MTLMVRKADLSTPIQVPSFVESQSGWMYIGDLKGSDPFGDEQFRTGLLQISFILLHEKKDAAVLAHSPDISFNVHAAGMSFCWRM